MDVVKKFKGLNVSRIKGIYSPHKPLLLLIALSRCLNLQERLAEFSSYDSALSILSEIFDKIQTEYPFGRLVNDELWEIENYFDLAKNSSGDLLRNELIEKKTRGGLNIEIYEVLMTDTSLLLSTVDELLNRYFSLELHSGIRQALNLPEKNFSHIPKMKNNLFEIDTLNDAQPEDVENRNITSNFHQNGYITYLNSLHNLGASGANALAESQALNPYFAQLYQPFPVVNEIFKALTDGRDRVVILTGHAGDGKSTVALDVLKKLRELPAYEPLAQPLKAREEISLSGGRVHIVKDMSELTKKERLDWLKEGFGEAGSWLIVSNTGPLLNSLSEFVGTLLQVDSIEIESKVLDLLDQSYQAGSLKSHTLQGLPKELVILNMTRLDNVSLGAGLLTKMVNHSAWEQCTGCASETVCPIKRNRLALQESGSVVEQRIRWVYQRLTAYERRLTLRQMVAHLALSLTGGMGCAKAHVYAKQVSAGNEGLERILFSESFFGYRQSEPWLDSESLRAVTLVRRQVFGGPTAPDFEREFSNDSGPAAMTLPASLNSVQMHWGLNAKEFSGVRWRFALRRMAFIFGQERDGYRTQSNIFLDTFLQSPRLRDFDQWRRAQSLRFTSSEATKLTKDCMQVLLEVFSGFSAGQFASGHDRLILTLRRSDRAVVQATQLVVAEFDFQDFQLQYDASRQIPILRYQPKEVDLHLSLPLLDFINNRSTGNLENDLAPVHLAQLECFRADLLRVANQRGSAPGKIGLLRSGIDGNVKLHRYLLDEENKRLERQ
jgi:hypothetical protein